MIRKLFILTIGSSLFLMFWTSLSYYVGLHANDEVKVFGGVGNKLIQFIVFPAKMTKRAIYYDGKGFLKNKKIPDGVSVFLKDSLYENLNILTSYRNKDKYIVELLNVGDGRTLKKWYPNLDLISKKTNEGENRLDGLFQSINKLNHVKMLSDSSIVSVTGYGLVKINSESKIEWIRTDYEAHHSLELDHDNNIWVPSKRLKSSFKELKNKENSDFWDDLIMKINPKNGDVLFEKSVIEILKENNLFDIVIKNGNLEMDPIHLNDVHPVLSDSDFWEKGDLLLSARHLSTIFLYRPSTNKIIWHKQGPWINQHDPDFLPNNKISVFGNQVFRTVPNNLSDKFDHPYEFNSVFVYDFETDSITEPYKFFLESEKIKTFTEGRSTILSNGDLFIEETNFGRVFIGDSIRKKVSFSRRLDDESISHLNWSRIIEN